jgi:hypothetical protein
MSTGHAQTNWLVETIAGFAGGFISTILLHPLDVIKTRLQGLFFPFFPPLCFNSANIFFFFSQSTDNDPQLESETPFE